MAEEKKSKTIEVLEKRLDEAIEMGNESLIADIMQKLDYLQGLSDPEDVDRLTKKSAGLRQYIKDVTEMGDLEDEAKKALDVEMPKRPERDEKTAKKTFSLEELGKIAQNTDGVGEIFEPDSDYYWQNWTNEQLNAYAKQAGMSRGDFLRKVAELDTKLQRNQIANEGVGGFLMSLFTPRRKKDIEEGKDPSWGSTILDVGENVAQALPIGKFLKGVKVIPQVGKTIIENAAVPSLFAAIDAASEGDVTEGVSPAVEGTAVNFFTPRALRKFKGVGKDILGTAEKTAETTAKKGGNKLAKTLDKYLVPVVESGAAESYVTNKLGKQQYGNRGLSMLSGIDPTGKLTIVLENLPGSEADKAKKEREKQKKLEKKHQEDLVKEYQARFGLQKYLGGK